MKKCPNCGEMNNDEMLFCGFCGKKINEFNFKETSESQMEVGTKTSSRKFSILGFVFALLSGPGFVVSFLLVAFLAGDQKETALLNTIGLFIMFLINIPLWLSYFFSIKALRNNKKMNSTKGNGLAITALVISCFTILFTAFILIGLANMEPF